MAEKLRHIENKSESGEHIQVRVERKEHASAAEKLEAGEKQRQSAEQARESVEQLAVSAEKVTSKNEKEAEPDTEAVVINKSYKSVMHRVEKQLPPYQRAFSKVIRNPAVDKTSVIVGDTIARPSGIIGGAGLAFFGLVLFGYYARTSGFVIPNSLFVVLVIGGWVGGLLFDFVFTSVKRIRLTR